MILSLLMVGLLLSSLFALSTSRLPRLIQLVGVQGILLACTPFVTGEGHLDIHSWLLFLTSFGIKGIFIPVLLFRAIRGVAIRKEIEPYVGFSASIVLGVAFAIGSFTAHRYMNGVHVLSSPLIPISMTIAQCGLFLVVARKKALTQIIGYLMLENAIYLFGVSLSVRNPIIVELGILLDLLVAVFVMGIVIHHINREFDSISTDELRSLRE